MYVNLHNLYVFKMNSYYSSRQAKNIEKSFKELFLNLSAGGAVRALKFSFVITQSNRGSTYSEDSAREHARKTHLALKHFLNHMRVLKYGKYVAGYSWLICNEKRVNRPYIYALFYIPGDASASDIAKCLSELWVRSVAKAAREGGWSDYPVVINYNTELGNIQYCRGKHPRLACCEKVQEGSFINEDLCGGISAFRYNTDNPDEFLLYLGTLQRRVRSIPGVRAWGGSALKRKH
ncbi:TPA: hypothetical protein N6S21_000975 [Escherichia coli]|uniref:hypothetical protein n=2 Tax=Escherichia coli TaxID=562 RepID=UPI0025A8ED54|nr:hypothetical protein [Escherichia coli]MCA8703294.1 hypothetical protein [Escherichia coli]HAP2127702.1 hypothetical protein [Escherichia coli]HCN3351748.1 hypothetical protein [Escherichia coli]